MVGGNLIIINQWGGGGGTVIKGGDTIFDLQLLGGNLGRNNAVWLIDLIEQNSQIQFSVKTVTFLMNSYLKLGKQDVKIENF